MSQLSHMLKFLNHLKSAEGELRQRLVEANKPLLRTDLAQKAAHNRIDLYQRHIRRLEIALQLVRAEQQKRAPAEDAEGGGSAEGEGT